MPNSPQHVPWSHSSQLPNLIIVRYHPVVPGQRALWKSNFVNLPIVASSYRRYEEFLFHRICLLAKTISILASPDIYNAETLVVTIHDPHEIWPLSNPLKPLTGSFGCSWASNGAIMERVKSELAESSEPRKIASWISKFHPWLFPRSPSALWLTLLYQPMPLPFSRYRSCFSTFGTTVTYFSNTNASTIWRLTNNNSSLIRKGHHKKSKRSLKEP